MPYLIEAADIQSVISVFSSRRILWIDTEVAEWWAPQRRLSLIQVLDNLEDLSGKQTYVLDVLDRPELVEIFLNKIMLNPNIEKVFHNASYDLRFLGGKQATTVTCTMIMANKIKNRLSAPNVQLKTLAVALCNFSNVDKDEGKSNWGRRPLTNKQLRYAQMDTVYLAQVHRRLLELTDQSPPQVVSKTILRKKTSNYSQQIRSERDLTNQNSRQPKSPENQPNQRECTPESTEDKQIWAEVLDRIERRTVQTLLRQHGYLLEFNSNLARIGIKSEALLKMVQRELSYVEAALQKVCGRQVQVILQVGTLPESKITPAAQQTTTKANNTARFFRAN